MSDPYFQELFADRIGGNQYGKSNDIYKFEKIKRAKAAARKDFPDRELIDFGIGENDEIAAEGVRQRLKIEVDKPENRGYADNGIAEYKEAAAAWMKRRLGVSLDASTQINHCIGTKPALAIIPALFINPGDITLMTTPGYPVAGTHTSYYGGEVYSLPLLKENNFLPDLSSIPDAVRNRAKLLVINYPNSPTGALATREFFEEVVAFAKQNNVVVVNDAAHINLTFGEKPMSFLSIPGALDVGVETHSMSKGWDMIGWRLGFIAGNPLLVQAFSDVKDNTDSGQFIAIQKAGIAALEDDSILERNLVKYKRRIDALSVCLAEMGFDATPSGGSYFLYVPSPKGLKSGEKFANAEEASQYLIRTHSICTVPWDNAGAYLRFSLTYQAADESAEKAICDSLKERLSSIEFVW
ncbi:UNVERIFIED_CONTAM: hypothetical protein GTU68_054012 [Idotea baltica]|nr:hypothetical protein [Idotea baltica]